MIEIIVLAFLGFLVACYLAHQLDESNLRISRLERVLNLREPEEAS